MRLFLLSLLLFSLALSSSHLVLASDLDLTLLPIPALLPLTQVSSQNLATTLIHSLFVLAGVSFFFYFLFGAVRWILSAGDKEGIHNATLHLRNSLIGLLIVLSVYGIGAIVSAVFGVDIFSVCFPGPDTPASFACPPSGIGSTGVVGTGGGPDGIKACPCYNNLGCTYPTNVANGGNGACFTCTTGGWESSTGNCSAVVISCGACL